jgi:aspartate/glutamate racemase
LSIQRSTPSWSAANSYPKHGSASWKLSSICSANGAQGIILGCTEIPLLVQPADTPLPLFDTTILHADAALNFALKAEPK